MSRSKLYTLHPTSSRMVHLRALPAEMFNLIIEHLVIAIGIQKAVLLRVVNQDFNAAILQAICVAQVIDIHDPATPCLPSRISASLRGKIIAVKARSAGAASKSYVSVVAAVNRALDTLLCETDQELVRSRHESIAATVVIAGIDDSVDARVDAQNLLSGAAIIGNLPVLKSLLERDQSLSNSADVNGITPYFHSPLTLAAAHGHLEVVQYLLNRGAHLDSVSGWRTRWDDFGEQADWHRRDPRTRESWLHQERNPSALRAAVLGGHEDIARLLLKPRYRLPTTSLEYLRAILAGAAAGRLDLIEAMFVVIEKDLSDFAGLDEELIWAAIRHDQKHVVHMLLDRGVDINAVPCPEYRHQRGSPYIAASLGNASMVRLLLGRGADVNFNGHEITFDVGDLPVEGAAQCGQDEVVELLIEYGADPVKALRSAAKGGQLRSFKLLLSRFPDLPFRERGHIGRMALIDAICSSNLGIITALVEVGVSLNEGYEYESELPLNMVKEDFPLWIVDHLISLGARQTCEKPIAGHDDEATAREIRLINKGRDGETSARGIRLSKSTWEWVGKY